MQIINLPRIGDETVKDRILEFLIEDNSLSLKELAYRITKTNSVTYHAVYKSVRQLVEKDIIDRNENRYCINKKWATKLKIIVDKIENDCNNHLSELDENESLNLSFENFLNFGKFLLNFPDLIKDSSNEELIINQEHIFNFLWMSCEDYNKFNKLGDRFKIYITCDNNCEIDEWFSKLWLNIGAKVCFGTNYCLTSDYLVFGDYVFQIFLGKELKDYLNDNKSKLKEIDISKIYNLMSNSSVKINVLKNKNLSDNIRERTLKHFKINE